MRFKNLTLATLFTGVSLFANSINIDDAYARATPPNLPNSAIFMDIKNSSDKDVSLVEAKSSISNVVELHTHSMKDGVMSMHQVPKIDVKANSTTHLKPGGFHVMLIGLKQKPLKEGQKVDVSLSFSNGEKIDLNVPVKKVMSGMKHHNMKHHKMKHKQ